ncbi:GreA/GreB family elongation factor [Imtechella halotolerans]|uniref:Transcription elongation factor n=1 Tax=Imtechella halotolerans K1 TaxID=946077 RepID=I0WKA4_9FLAO|nr:GreA/GreB family elongation factor [Imtechella halotolerans]EID76820.1 transcription elongation factor [Imtechella halotolerans K1]WMQ62614.1 GreA/GreB family elongation factor [Imtechella halotolerans]
MKYGNLIIEEKEYTYLKTLLDKVGFQNELQRNIFTRLKEELTQAEVKSEIEMPNDVVRFNSIVDINTPYGVKHGYELVKPEDGNVHLKRLSILTPMGSALIGYAKGDEIVWQFPDGEKSVTIVNVVRYDDH